MEAISNTYIHVHTHNIDVEAISNTYIHVHTHNIDVEAISNTYIHVHTHNIDVEAISNTYIHVHTHNIDVEAISNTYIHVHTHNIDVEAISKFAQCEFKYGEKERGGTMFESLVTSYPRRTDLWSVYVDMLVKARQPDKARYALSLQGFIQGGFYL